MNNKILGYYILNYSKKKLPAKKLTSKEKIKEYMKDKSYTDVLSRSIARNWLPFSAGDAVGIVTGGGKKGPGRKFYVENFLATRAAAAAGGLAGSTLIPIPVAGTLVGSYLGGLIGRVAIITDQYQKAKKSGDNKKAEKLKLKLKDLKEKIRIKIKEEKSKQSKKK